MVVVPLPRIPSFLKPFGTLLPNLASSSLVRRSMICSLLWPSSLAASTSLRATGSSRTDYASLIISLKSDSLNYDSFVISMTLKDDWEFLLSNMFFGVPSPWSLCPVDDCFGSTRTSSDLGRLRSFDGLIEALRELRICLSRPMSPMKLFLRGSCWATKEVEAFSNSSSSSSSGLFSAARLLELSLPSSITSNSDLPR